MTLTIEPFQEQHLDDAAALLAACEAQRTAHPRQRPFRLDDVRTAWAALAEIAPGGQLDGVLARRDGAPAGFMLGSRELADPTSVAALFRRPRAIMIDDNGYAAPTNGYDLYRAMYARLAEAWARHGFLDHYVSVPLSDPAALRAWRSLGFGAEMVRGLRSTGPVEAAAAAVQIDRAAAEDIGVVMALEIGNVRYHAQSPMCSPFFPETEPALRAEEREQLAEPENARFVAYRDGAAQGMVTFRPWAAERPGLLAPTVHLQHGFTIAPARQGGVARALLDVGMAWAREQGYERCSVNWMAANPLGARFWQAQGFLPVGNRLYRHIEARGTLRGK